MKILHIMTTPIGLTGISTYIYNIMDYLDTQKNKIDYVFMNQPLNEIQILLKQNNSNYHIIQNRNRKPFSYAFKLNEVLKKERYDIVHVHGNSHTIAIELMVAKKNRIPVRIAHAHSTSTKYFLLHKLLTLPFNYCTTHRIASSQAAGNWLFSKAPFNVVPIGIKVESFKFQLDWRQVHRKKLDIEENEILIGHVGEFNKNKNQTFLIHLMSKLDENFKLILIGEGNLKDEYQQLVAQLKIEDRVIFYGKSREANQIYSAMDMFIFPSYNEGLGLVIIEAQSSDLTCFASLGVPEEANITDQVEKFSLDENLEMLVDRIQKISVNLPDKRKKNINNNKVEKSNYNAKKSIEALEKKYKIFLEESNY